ncbi:beta-propeller domain-containing protein [Candidatus Uabimicrobium amorphum]|uniref:DUF4062 domain-containing protein n=1 Tax=Uabimicrobium amorphum TaxID=2596890 RepID=A0A5S9IK69_UABAM|nr:DUF4062 domain-containing protein [Candidatus Uabimicrobium amorphum]BBM82966.1 hypothetical protein UABAM_01309 [Candidatus Uabimicrobium amorphum]
MHIWTTLKIFISSTFRDLELERDRLALIFQKLQKQVFERRLHIIPYDLRWREDHHDDLVRWCINMVMECQYFVGILGYRYGWRPPKDFDGAENSDHISITEMEIRKALEVIPKNRRFFCFGDLSQYDDSVRGMENEQDQHSLQSLKIELQEKGEKVFVYHNTEELLEIIATNIEKIIDCEYPPGVKADLQSYSKKDALSEIIEEKRRGFVGQQQHLAHMAKFCRQNTAPNTLAIEAVAGTGKSALLAEFIYKWQDTPIIAHYMSMAGESRSVRGIVNSLAEQLQQYGFIENLQNSDLKILEQVHEVLQTTERSLVVAIDGFDEMDDEGHNLRWLPKNFSQNVRLILTTRPTSIWPKIQEHLTPEILSLPPLDEESIRLIIRQQQNKLSVDEENLLIKRACGSPLFLKVALDEMSAGGIAVGQLAETVESLFHQILDRLQNAYGKQIITCYLGLIASSRNGLAEVEIREIMLRDFREEFADDFLVVLQNNLANFVIPREKLLTFFHPEFERSVKMWLGRNNLRNSHLRLAAFFREQGFGYERSLTEIAYQTQWGEDYTSLLQLFSDIDFLEKKCCANMLSDLRNDIEFATTAVAVPLPADLCIDLAPGVSVKRDSLQLMGSIIDLELHFLIRHPQCLIQSLWNHGYWYDAPQASSYYAEKKSISSPHFYKFVDYLRQQKESRGGWKWLQSLSPLPETLNAATIKILRGHEDIATSVAMNAKQNIIVSGSWDRSVRVWDSESGRCFMTLKGHSHYISGISFCHPHQVVTSSGDSTLRIWDIQKGDCIRTLEGHTDEIACVSSNEDGNLIVSGSKDKTVRVWSRKSGECLHVLNGHTKTVNGVCLSDDESIIASASWDHTIRIWNAKSGECINVLKGHSRDVKSVCMDKDKRLLFSASRDYSVRIWDLQSGECLRTLPHKSIVFVVSCSSDGRYVATSVFGTIRVWDVQSGECIKKFEGHESAIFGLQMTGDAQRIISASSDKTIRLWNANSESQISFPIGHEDVVLTTSFSHCNKNLVTSSKDTYLHIWDVASGRKVRTISTEEYTRFAHYTPDDRYVYYGGSSKDISFYDLEQDTRAFKLTGHEKVVMCAKVSSDGRFLASGDRGHNVHLWDIAQQKCLQKWKEHQHDVRSIDISSDNRYVASGAEDRTIQIWDIQQQKLVATLVGHSSGVTSVAFVGNQLVSASRDNTIRFWDYMNAQCVKIVEGNCNVEQFLVAKDFYVATQDLETTCQTKQQESIAFFPSLIRNAFFSPEGYICGYGGTYTYFLKLQTS